MPFWNVLTQKSEAKIPWNLLLMATKNPKANHRLDGALKPC